jgi:hypothetical protein
MIEVVTALVRPSFVLSADTVEQLASLPDWGGFCAIVANAGCAALVYERLRNREQAIPTDVSAWLQVQHAYTRESNRRLVDELHRVISALEAREIQTLVLKGPVLALLGTGLAVRPFRDLDLLVRPEDLVRAIDTLRPLGFAELRHRHSYHRILVRQTASSTAVIEIHFDLVDVERGYTPAMPGVWNRAVTFDLPGCTVSAPSITDHLLLTIMQLPHHHWNPRLLIDVAHLAARWRSAIDWEAVVEHARAWRMRVLTGATLRAMSSLFQFALPPAAARIAEPISHLERIQWDLVKRALTEQLRLDPPTIGGAASYLVLDRPATMLALAPRMVLGPHVRGRWTNFTQIGRRLRAGAARVPALLAIISKTAFSRHQRVH